MPKATPKNPPATRDPGAHLPIDAPERRRLPPLLRRCWYNLNQTFRRRIAHTGVTPDQFTVLRTLTEGNPKGLSQRELSDCMSSDANTIAALLERMAALGLVERAPHEQDRRAYRIQVKPAGLRKYEEIRTIAVELQAEILAVLPQAKREEFLQHLALVASRLPRRRATPPVIPRTLIFRATPLDCSAFIAFRLSFPPIFPQSLPTRMAAAKYQTAPVETTRMPPGVPYIIGNEAAERFSFYGMRAILVVVRTEYLVGALGQPERLTDAVAYGWVHLFVASAYFFPLLGAIVADVFWGKYFTIISLSLVYCLGHLTLALNDTRVGLAIGLALIAVGSGGIKPCVSSNVGDQFGRLNQHLLSRVYGWFYFSINLGSFFSILLIPKLLNNFGPHIAFGTPGLLMLLATWIFWLGRNKFVHVPPSGSQFVRDAFSLQGLKSIAGLLLLYVFIAVFWSLYDQCSSAWVEQAEKMNRHLFGFEWQADQFQAANPLLILIYIPLFNYAVYPAFNKIFLLTPLRKISIGLFVTACSFLVPAWVAARIDAGFTPPIAWQLLAYLLLIAGEVLVSITGLEFSYRQAPKSMKAMMMSFFLATVSAGNLFTSGVNFFIQNKDHTSKLSGPGYYLFFAGLMFATAVVFIPVAYFYRDQGEFQDEAQPAQP